MAKSPDDSRLELLQGTLDMLILRTLQWGPQHGHGIGQAIRAQSDDLLRVETGSLYPALHRLERQKLLESYWTEADGRRRKYYKLTTAGRKALAARRDEWQAFATAVNGVLGLQRSIVPLPMG